MLSSEHSTISWWSWHLSWRYLIRIMWRSWRRLYSVQSCRMRIVSVHRPFRANNPICSTKKFLLNSSRSWVCSLLPISKCRLTSIPSSMRRWNRFSPISWVDPKNPWPAMRRKYCFCRSCSKSQCSVSINASNSRRVMFFSISYQRMSSSWHFWTKWRRFLRTVGMIQLETMRAFPRNTTNLVWGRMSRHPRSDHPAGKIRIPVSPRQQKFHQTNWPSITTATVNPTKKPCLPPNRRTMSHIHMRDFNPLSEGMRLRIIQSWTCLEICPNPVPVEHKAFFMDHFSAGIPQLASRKNLLLILKLRRKNAIMNKFLRLNKFLHMLITTKVIGTNLNHHEDRLMII